MKKKQPAETVQIAVKISPSLDRAIEVFCARRGMLKRDFVARACDTYIVQRQRAENSNA
jgi:hypothetical protein